MGSAGNLWRMCTVRQITRAFLDSVLVRVKLGQNAPATHEWYRRQLGKLTRAAGDLDAAGLRLEHLVAVPFGYHFIRAVKTLYRWAADEDVQLVARDPFRRVPLPPCGERQRVLTRSERCRLMRAAGRPFRRFLFVLAHTIARPGEIRGMRWGDIQWDRRLIVLTAFKGRSRRRDGVKVRAIPLDKPTARLLGDMHRRAGRPGPEVPVWIGRHGAAWTNNALRCLMRRARVRAGLDQGGAGERVVCYTLRHTAATDATRRGVTDATLARVMGHARTSTTARYQHLAGNDLVDAIDRLAARPRLRAG